MSPYNFVDNNPVRYIDPDGREIVDPKGKRVDITVNKDGSLTFSKNATQSIIRVANALNMTETGRGQLQQMISSNIKVKINVSEKTVVRQRDGKNVYTYGRTIQGNNNEKDNYGKTKNADGTYAVKEATMTVYEESIKEAAKEGSNSKLEGLSTEQGIGAVAGHESVHATDKAEINKDIQAEVSGGDRTKAREVKPNKIEQKIIDEYKK